MPSDCSIDATILLISGNSSGQVIGRAGWRKRRERGRLEAKRFKSQDGFRTPATGTV